MVPRRIGLLMYADMQALDLVGPMDAFAAAQLTRAGRSVTKCYEVVTIGLDSRAVRAESGLVLKPQYTVKSAPHCDTLIIPGGRAMREAKTSERVAAWLIRQDRDTRRIAAVCTGVFGLAASGLADGRRVTTHWQYAQELVARFPKLKVDASALFLRDGRIYTSAGITAGIDLTLALIEEDHGPSIALSVARELVVYLRREGGQSQFSEPLRFQSKNVDRIADVAGWIGTNLQQDLSVQALAERARLCPRQFTRRFKQITGSTPAEFVEKTRLDEARRRLTAHQAPLGQVALSVGYRSDDVFSKAFERRFGVAPGAFKRRFKMTARFDQQ